MVEQQKNENLNHSRDFCFFDSHCHLQEPEIIWDIEGIMERWKKNKGNTIVCCGTKESDWQAVGEIASKFETVHPCFGVHPWFIEDVSDKWFYELDRYLDMSFESKCLYIDSLNSNTDENVEMSINQNIHSYVYRTRKPYIGEIGLDHVIKGIDKEKQKIVFKTQMGIAKERNIPVSIHIRKGWDVLMKILKQMGYLRAGGMIHSYSGPADLIPLLEKYGLYISFSGSVTNSDNKKVQNALKAVSSNRLLIETDSPAILPRYPDDFTDYSSHKITSCRLNPDSKIPNTLESDVALYSEPNLNSLCQIKEFIRSKYLFKIGWNEPCNIFLVAIAVSKILDIPLREVAYQTNLNGEALFKIGSH